MNTLLLDVVQWDLLVDADANIAVAADPYSMAQDAASAIRTFQGECYYYANVGIPYWSNVLGYAPPLSLIKAYVETQALTVPGVTAAVCYIASFVNRTVTGQVQITSATGQTQLAGF